MMASSVLKAALMVAFAALSSAAPAAPASNQTLDARAGIALPGGVYCCTWDGCADCEYGKCILNIDTAQGVCPFKGGTLPSPIPSGAKCCKGDGCQLCGLEECFIPPILGGNGYCPWPADPQGPKVIDPGMTCTGKDKCRFGNCILPPGSEILGICPREGQTKPGLGQGESCCLEANCAPCLAPYFCQILAVPNPLNLPPGTCQF
ncbi:hypothetical protein ESCO_004898 [Escovopsis weberi]|uniref:Uncharacterized protein n=1 Tax=Escovopsis weberi TaxID=150374 RepID=A0A0M9VRP3_ESCWE|nr:hypothetical protein ESCO_004898 [Escovopsis weberi]